MRERKTYYHDVIMTSSFFCSPGRNPILEQTMAVTPPKNRHRARRLEQSARRRITFDPNRLRQAQTNPNSDMRRRRRKRRLSCQGGMEDWGPCRVASDTYCYIWYGPPQCLKRFSNGQFQKRYSQYTRTVSNQPIKGRALSVETICVSNVYRFPCLSM